MSHNTSALAPYITEHTSALSTAGAGQSLVIKGFGLGLSTVVDIPAALGVETARTFTKTGATAGVLTITLTVEAIPDPFVSRSIKVSTGGVPAQGSEVTAGAISVWHGGPDSISDLVIWLDARDDSTIIDTAGDVSSWTSKATGGHAFTQSTGSKQPHKVTSATLGAQALNVFRPDAHFLEKTNHPRVADNTGSYSYMTIFSVFSMSDLTGGNLLFVSSSTAYFSVGVSTGLQVYVHPTLEIGPTDGAALSPDTKYLAMYRFTPSGVQTYLNGALDYQSTGMMAADNLGDGEAIEFTVGQNASNPDVNGDVGEILVYKRELTDAEVDKVESYLNGRWSIY